MERPDPSVHAHAEVATPQADAWVRRLAAHLGRRTDAGEPVEEAGWTVLRLAGGSCSMTGTGSAVVLDVSAPDDASLAVVQDLVGGSLERLAADERLRVAWERRPG